MSEEKSICQLCGEPMPPGEEMFNYHGYSGPCPKPPLQKKVNYDSKCLDLAEHFLRDNGRYDETDADELAQAIQIAVEQFFCDKYED